MTTPIHLLKNMFKNLNPKWKNLIENILFTALLFGGVIAYYGALLIIWLKKH